VALISKVNPFPKPDWMANDVYQKSIQNTMKATLWGMLEDTLEVTLGDTLWTTLFIYFDFLLAGEEHEAFELQNSKYPFNLTYFP